jgi:hypothetical protein
VINPAPYPRAPDPPFGAADHRARLIGLRHTEQGILCTGGTQPLNASAAARYMRMYGTVRGTLWGNGLREFQLSRYAITITG